MRQEDYTLWAIVVAMLLAAAAIINRLTMIGG